jgi:hypothetical protein
VGEEMYTSFVINHWPLCRTRLSNSQVRSIQETIHTIVRAFETENPRWQKAPEDKIMSKYKDECLKPGTIGRSSLSQKIHSEEICDRLFDILGKDSSALGEVLVRWPPRWIDSDSLALRIERCRTNSGLLGHDPHQIWLIGFRED